MDEPESLQTDTFMFLPDLTGYTRYMSATDSEKSHIVIERLLRSLVNSDRLNLEISDIAGDAIFFYRLGSPPPFANLVGECLTMINVVRETLISCMVEFGWWNEAAVKAQSLSLKFVAHYGNARVTEIGGHSQIISKSAIEAHKLLKNSVELDNYLLISEECFNACEGASHPRWMGVEGSDLYQDLGVLQYRAFNLTEIAKNFT